jgi:hypothetical protein
MHKKFWEELIVYFPLIGHGPHRKLKNKEREHTGTQRQYVLISLLTKVRGHTNRQTVR